MNRRKGTYAIAIRQTSIRKIDTFPMIRPTQPLITRIPKLLIPIAISGTSPNLKLRSILRRSVSDVETLAISEELDGAGGEGPLLG